MIKVAVSSSLRTQHDIRILITPQNMTNDTRNQYDPSLANTLSWHIFQVSLSIPPLSISMYDVLQHEAEWLMDGYQ
jgi:hypothetical protein